MEYTSMIPMTRVSMVQVPGGGVMKARTIARAAQGERERERVLESMVPRFGWILGTGVTEVSRRHRWVAFQILEGTLGGRRDPQLPKSGPGAQSGRIRSRMGVLLDTQSESVALVAGQHPAILGVRLGTVVMRTIRSMRPRGPPVREGRALTPVMRLMA